MAVYSPIRRDVPVRTAARLASQHYPLCGPALRPRPASVRASARSRRRPMGAPLRGRARWKPRRARSRARRPAPARAPAAPAPPRVSVPRTSPAAVAGTAPVRRGPGLWEAERPQHRGSQPRQPHAGSGGDVPGRGPLGDFFQGGRTTPALRPLSSRRSGAGAARQDLGGPGKPGCCEALMKKVTAGWGSGGVGHPDRPSRRGPDPSRSGAEGEVA